MLLNITTALAFEAFIVNDIRIAGLQRVSTGSILIQSQFLLETRLIIEKLLTLQKHFLQQNNLMTYKLEEKVMP